MPLIQKQIETLEYLIVFVRSQFKAGRVPSYPAGFLSYLATSTVYWAFLIFLIDSGASNAQYLGLDLEALGEQFVLVALRDGTHIGGLMGSDSFVSSDPAERDIRIQQIYDY